MRAMSSSPPEAAILPSSGADVSGAVPKVYFLHQPRTVALVAMGPSTIDFLNDTLTQELKREWADETWAINMAANAIWHDVVFWMDDLIAQSQFKPGLFDLLRHRGKPVITTDRRPEIVPNSFDYPIDEIMPLSLQMCGRPYLNNGVAMAIAYAMWKGVKQVRLYGADFTYPDRNYAEAGRACVESWIVFAVSRGMAVELSPGTSLFDIRGGRGIYGYREQPMLTIGGETCKFLKTMPPTGPLMYRPEDSSGIRPDSGSAEQARA